MNVDRTLPTLLLPISCFDKRRAQPLPVYNRWYWLDWAKLDDMQRAEILHIVGNEERNSQHRPVGFDETIITMSVGSPNDGRQILKYRNSFDAVPDNDIEAFYNDPARHQGAFQTVNYGFEYFEDENGMPISKYQMIEHVSGQALPILLGDPQSVVRLGPMAAANSGSWTVAKANTIGQFLDVVERIYASEWFRSPHFITSLSQKTGESKLLEAQFPDDAETMSVLAYFRQLHAGDKLLVKACDAYLAHMGDRRKHWWVTERRESFVSLIDSPPDFHGQGGPTRRQILQMFMYGAGMLHSSSNHGDDQLLQAFIGQHGQHEAVMIFNSCLMEFYRVAATIHPVIRQDYDHWLAVDGLAPPERIDIPNLFQGFVSPPHGTS